ERRTLVVDAQLVDAALEAVEARLQRPNHLLGHGELGVLGEVREVDEEDRQGGQLRGPVGLPGVEAAADRGRDERAEARGGLGRDDDALGRGLFWRGLADALEADVA